ncbi:MAG: hypothetical protein GYB68_19165, partial [Chloroflexi bacterium]|nr:hypothetical protein [Chloroflexota bacterium]
MHRMLALLMATLVLAACGSSAPAEPSSPTLAADPPSNPDADTSSEEPAAELPPVAEGPSSLDVVRGVVVERVGNPDQLNLTLLQLMSVTLPDGEALVFHFEDTQVGTTLGCSGYAVVRPDESGQLAIPPAGISVTCGPPIPPEP